MQENLVDISRINLELYTFNKTSYIYLSIYLSYLRFVWLYMHVYYVGLCRCCSLKYPATAFGPSFEAILSFPLQEFLSPSATYQILKLPIYIFIAIFIVKYN